MKLSEVPPPPQRAAGYECGFAAVWNAADDDDRATLAGWLANPDATDTWVAERLTEHLGVPVNYQVVARHRRGQCVRCQRAGRVWI